MYPWEQDDWGGTAVLEPPKIETMPDDGVPLDPYEPRKVFLATPYNGNGHMVELYQRIRQALDQEEIEVYSSHAIFATQHHHTLEAELRNHVNLSDLVIPHLNGSPDVKRALDVSINLGKEMVPFYRTGERGLSEIPIPARRLVFDDIEFSSEPEAVERVILAVRSFYEE